MGTGRQTQRGGAFQRSCTAYHHKGKEEAMTASPLLGSLSPAQIRDAVAERYGQVATDPAGEFNFPVGRDFALAVGYPPEVLAILPETAARSFAGVTYYHGRSALRPGETVLDLGSGAGLDAILAARAVGLTGRV